MRLSSRLSDATLRRSPRRSPSICSAPKTIRAQALRKIFDAATIVDWWQLADTWLDQQKLKNAFSRNNETEDAFELDDEQRSVVVGEALGVTALDAFNEPVLEPIAAGLLHDRSLRDALVGLTDGSPLSFGRSSFLQFNQSSVMWHNDVLQNWKVDPLG